MSNRERVEDEGGSKPGNVTLFKIGDRFTVQQEITSELMAAFRALSLDDNPMHQDDSFAIAHGYRGRIAYGNILGLMVSRLVGVGLPTQDVVIIRQSIDFRQPLYVNDNVRLTAEVTAIHEAIGTIQLKLTFQTGVSDPACTGVCLLKCL